jgi:hypothetical protein
MAASKVINRCKDVEEAEACGVCEGLKLAMDNNLELALLESDCSTAVNTVNSKSGCTSRGWAIYKDIESLSSLFPLCNIVKIGRNSNMVAHYLAALASRSGTNKVWVSSIPDEIQELACKDYVMQTSDQ